MERRLVVWPGWLGGPDDAPRPEWDSPAGEWLAQAQVERLVAPEQVSRTPEVAWFGLEPHLYTTEDGPLAVGAMGKDFPGPVGARDTLFALDWMTLDADNQLALMDPPTGEAWQALTAALKPLNTPRLTLAAVRGHCALAWHQGSLDLGVLAPAEAAGKLWQTALPQGDGEPMLRRFIDDGINILMEHEINRRRVDEGHAPWLVLWPWGPGFRPDWPSFGLPFGSPLGVVTSQRRVRGIAHWLGVPEQAVDCRLEMMPAPPDDPEEREYKWREWAEANLDPRAGKAGPRISVVHTTPDGKPGEVVGLMAQGGGDLRAGNGLPFDARALDEKRAPRTGLVQAVRQALRAPLGSTDAHA